MVLKIIIIMLWLLAHATTMPAPCDMTNSTTLVCTNTNGMPHINDEVTTLIISQSTIKKFNFDGISLSNKIENMFLSGNRIEQLPNSFMILKYLKILDLSENNITYIPENIFEHNENLDVVNLSNNPLTSLPALKSKSLTEVDVSSWPLTSIKKHPLSNLTNLITFKMENIHSLETDSILRLMEHSIRHMILTNTTIICNEMTQNLLNEQRKRGMDLKGPLCTTIKEEEHCTTPKECYYTKYTMDCNGLNDQLTNICKRQKVTVKNGNLPYVAPISNILDVQIYEVILKNNKILNIDKESVSSLSKLRFLSLRENKINYLPSDIIEDNNELETLDLSGNNFNEAPIIRSTSLKILNLSNCNIRIVKIEVFLNLPNLKNINLDSNLIAAIDPKIKVTYAFNYLTLENNPIEATNLPVNEKPVTSIVDETTKNDGIRSKLSFLLIIIAILVVPISNSGMVLKNTSSKTKTKSKYIEINHNCDEQYG